MPSRIETTRFEIPTWDGVSLHDVTDTIGAWVALSGIEEGLCVLSLHDSSCAFTLSGDLEDTYDDVIRMGRDRLSPGATAPSSSSDRLDDIPDSGYAAVIAATTLTLPVRSSRLATGAWESVVLVDPDGPAHRQIDATVVGE